MSKLKDIYTSIKNFILEKVNANPNLTVSEYRDYLTPRDEAFIFACHKFEVLFESYHFFSLDALSTYHRKDTEYSLIKVNFDKLKETNHLFVFIGLYCKDFSWDKYCNIKSLIYLFDGKSEALGKNLELVLKAALENQMYWDYYYKLPRSVWDAIKGDFYTTLYFHVSVDLTESMRYVYIECPNMQAEYDRREREKKYQRSTYNDYSTNESYSGFNYYNNNKKSNYKPEETQYSSMFNVLHLQPTKDKTVIKAAYKKLVIMYHPDKIGENDTIRRINEAYNTLMKL